MRHRAGLVHTCGLVTDGTAYCWGFPQAVGSQAGSSVLSPLAVGGTSRFTKLSAGSHWVTMVGKLLQPLRPSVVGCNGGPVRDFRFNLT